MKMKFNIQLLSVFKLMCVLWLLCEIGSNVFVCLVTLGLTTAWVKQIRNSLFSFYFMLVSEAIFLAFVNDNK